jgi:TolB-like protein
MNFLSELRRRNVFRVGFAYAIVGWLLLQVADLVLENINAPDWIMQVVMLLVALGLPLVLVFAWAFELTPEGVRREKNVDRQQSITRETGKRLNSAILVLMALAIAYLLFDRFAGPAAGPAPAVDVSGPAAPQDAEPAAVPAPAINRQSIAVLPFQNRSRLEEDEFFVAGIHDDLLTNLARIGSLKVISRTSMMRFKDTARPIPEIAAELGVAAVMEGAVQRSGNTVRINVQLIDAASDEHLWAEIFDRELTAENLFAIQSEISEKIAEALKATLSPEEQQRISDRPTENLAAYNAYLRGRQLMARRNSEDLYQALAEFERAVELDPQFALGWVGVAEAANLLPTYSTADPIEMDRRQEEAARNALALNDQLGEAHLSLAGVHAFHERWDEAEAAFKKAIELSPNYASAYHWYADFITRWVRRAEESLALTRKAVELDPLSSILQLEIAEKLDFLGRFDEAEAQTRRLLELDPGFAPASSMMSAIKDNQGQFDQEIAWLRKSTELDPGRIGNYVPQAFAALNLGDADRFADIQGIVYGLDDQHWANGWLDVMQNLYEQNYPAAMESARWLDSRLGQQPSFQVIFGFMHLVAGNYPEARAAFKLGVPGFFTRETWPEALDAQNGLGCVVAYVMARTGDPDLGRELLETTIAYMEDDLPRYIEHADRFGYANCYAINGDLDKAMQAFETQVDHGHYAFWWITARLPWFELLRGTPRFEAAMQSIRDNNAAQRKNLQDLTAEAGP